MIESIMIRHDINDHFYEDKTSNIIYFFTLKDKMEIAYLDLKTNILYINNKYKSKFINVKSEIKQKYKINKTSEYFNL